jgi:V/A-type H+-transporting ATPase subunit E
MSARPQAIQSRGVQDLIEQIHQQGVSAARQESERLLSDAKAQAEAIKAKATADSRALVEAARQQIQAEQTASGEAIRNAARDAMLELRNRVRDAFEVHVRRLVSQQAQDPGFVRNLVLVLAGHAASEYVKDHEAVIFVGKALAGEFDRSLPEGEISRKIQSAVLGAAGQMLREGITLAADDDLAGGVRVAIKGSDLEIDMSDEALSRMLLKHLLPRYRAIVQAEDGAR